MLEENLRRAMLISQGDPTIFVRSPLSLSLLVVAVLVLGLVLAPSINRKRDEAFTE
jgi:TctA family transporter